jgi:predicted nucleotidyltransferase
MTPNVPDILDQVRPRLAEAFGDRFRQVVLYGSYARGNPKPDSDIDLMVVLQGPIRLGRDLERAIHVIYPLQLELDTVFEVMPVDEKAYEAGEFGLYRQALSEGVPL